MTKLFCFIFINVFFSNFIFGQKEFEIVHYDNFDTSLIKVLMVKEINKYRAKYNLSPMQFDTVTDEMAQYDASYVCENTFPSSIEEMNFFYYFDIPHQGILLRSPYDRLDYFSGLRRVNRKLIRCINMLGVSYDWFTETYKNFAETTVLNWLQSDFYDYASVLRYEAEDIELIGVGVSFKRMEGGEQPGTEVYINVVISSDK